MTDIDMAIYLKKDQCRFYQLREKINRASGNTKDADDDLKVIQKMKCVK
jgi:hypothetical protein